MNESAGRLSKYCGGAGVPASVGQPELVGEDVLDRLAGAKPAGTLVDPLRAPRRSRRSRRPLPAARARCGHDPAPRGSLPGPDSETTKSTSPSVAASSATQPPWLKPSSPTGRPRARGMRAEHRQRGERLVGRGRRTSAPSSCRASRRSRACHGPARRRRSRRSVPATRPSRRRRRRRIRRRGRSQAAGRRPRGSTSAPADRPPPSARRSTLRWRVVVMLPPQVRWLRVECPPSRIRTKRVSDGQSVRSASRRTYGSTAARSSARIDSSSSTVTGTVAPPTNDAFRHASGRVAGREPAQDPISLALDEDALELLRRRARTRRPALLELGQPPGPLAGVLARRRLLHEAVLRELTEMERAAGLARAEPAGALGGRRLTERSEQLDEIEPKRVSERTQGAGVRDLHDAKDTFDILDVKELFGVEARKSSPSGVSAR